MNIAGLSRTLTDPTFVVAALTLAIPQAAAAQTGANVLGTSGRSGTNASVDSELTLLYCRRTGESVPIVGFVPNPYFAGATAFATVEPFTHRSHDIYLVTTLDGYTLQDASAELSAAVTADSTLAHRAEIQRLQQQLAGKNFELL